MFFLLRQERTLSEDSNMTQGVTNTAQLSLFPLIQAAIIANSTLSPKFKTNNILEFEPKQKSANFVGFPYILVNTTPTDTQRLTMDNSTTQKEFGATLSLILEYVPALTNFTDFAEALIFAIESYESTFQASGFLNVEINFVDRDDNQVIHQKEVIEGIFDVTFDALVER